MRKSTIDRTVIPFKVLNLVYAFDRWLGDDIVTSLGEFIVTERLRQRLVEFAGTGYHFDKVRVTKSAEFKFTVAERPNAYPPLPKFHWLKITGVAWQDDFGYGENLDLIVSEAALSVLKSCRFAFGTAEEIQISKEAAQMIHLLRSNSSNPRLKDCRERPDWLPNP